jgi:cyclopropane fatty-acyl-phospholipid synthase-like methyltransferase
VRDDPRPPVPSTLYDDAYFETCEGYGEFSASDGAELSARLQAAWELADVRPGQTVLDLGCGRGEVLVWGASRAVRAWGLDFSAAAVGIARQAAIANGVGDLVRIQRGEARALPYAGATFDRVLMLDLVEHLHPPELGSALREVRRVLKPEGRLLVHTMPNLWYYRYGYPLYRGLQRLRGQRLPANPRERFKYHAAMHVNEQHVLSLQANLRRAGFRARVWATNVLPYAQEHGRLGAMVDWLCRLYPFKWVLCNDLFALAWPTEPRR